mmetsp:Transcript_62659/g.123880  ORF Transcript_62659/g.123880 Transcript_62659/m.123880 type:complete len:878 (-) Transcript_62659:19-2652(-)
MRGRHKERRRSCEDIALPPEDTHRLRLRSRSPGNDGGEWHRGGLRAWREEMSAGMDDKHEDMPTKLSHRRGGRVEDRDRARYPAALEGELMERMPRSRRSVRTALENELEEDGGAPLPHLRPARRAAKDDVLIDSDDACEQGDAAKFVERSIAVDGDLADASQATKEHRQRHKRRRHDGERRRRHTDEIADAMQQDLLAHSEVDNMLSSRSIVEHQHSTTLTEVPVKEVNVKRRKRKHDSEMAGEPPSSVTMQIQEQTQEDLVIIRREEPRDRRRHKYSDNNAFQDAQTDVPKPKDKKRKDKRKQMQCQGEEAMMQHGRETLVPSNEMLGNQSDQLLDNTIGQRESRCSRKEVEPLQVADEALENKQSKRMKCGHHHAEKAKKDKDNKKKKRDDDELKRAPSLVPDEQQPEPNDDTDVPRPTMPAGAGISAHQIFQPHMMGRPPVFGHMMSSLMRPMFGMMPNGLMMMRPGMGHPVGHPAINASMMPGMGPGGNMAMKLPGHASATSGADDREGLPRKSKPGREPLSISDTAATCVLASRSCSSSSASSSSSNSSFQAEQDVTASTRENVETDVVPPAAGSPETISKAQDCMNSPIPLDAQVDDESTAFTESAGEMNDGPGQSVPLAAPPGVESPPLFGVAASEGEAAFAVGAEEGGDAQGALLLLPSLQKPRNAGWHEVQQSRSIEDLRLELEVASSKEGVSIATQTDGDPTNVPEECIDYWFAGFSFPIAAPGPLGSPKAIQAQEVEGGGSASPSPVASHEIDVVQGHEGTCRPERHIRRRPLGSRSQSPANVVEPVAAQPATGSERKRSSSASSHGSSSSSSATSGRRQRATSSEREGPDAAPVAPLAAVAGAVQATASIPRSLRAVPDYSDVM